MGPGKPIWIVARLSPGSKLATKRYECRVRFPSQERERQIKKQNHCCIICGIGFFHSLVGHYSCLLKLFGGMSRIGYYILGVANCAIDCVSVCGLVPICVNGATMYKLLRRFVPEIVFVKIACKLWAFLGFEYMRDAWRQELTIEVSERREV